MLSAVGMKRAAAAVLLGAALCVGCGGRWLPPKTYEVPTQTDQRASYTAVLELAASKGYTVLTKDDAAAKARLQAKSNGKSFIDVEVVAGQVKLIPMGALVRDGKVHRVLTNELNNLEVDLQQRFGGGTAPAVASVNASLPPAPPPPDGAAMPQAWSEPAYDPSVWGNGNFTCLPVRVPAEHQSALTLQLSNGEKADLQLSLAYAPELCRSPTQCKQPGGCPALGIGDPERVNRIAARLSKGEIAAQATLLDGGKPVANIDLAHHGSIVQAMSEIKR
ncbi:MAG TPA: hypothetical protein VHP33_14855 [Polyangiaceae bacterium]|nr:hypothetical protein [Polyangiaceae bacterium]